MIGLYRIISPSDAIYIGQSWNIEERFAKGYSGLAAVKAQRRLYNSFSKYGIKTHIFEIICELPSDTTQEILDRYEIFYIDQYKDCGIDMMNLKSGGRGGKHSQETKDIIRRKNKGKIGYNKGKTFSKETRDKISATRMRRYPVKKRVKLTRTEVLEAAAKINRKSIIQYNGDIKIGEYMSIRQASKVLNISNTNICNVLNNRTKTAGGFVWKYKNSLTLEP